MESKTPIIAVDFDNCLSFGTYDTDPNKCTYELNVKLVAALKAFRVAGGKVILWTCRSGAHLKDAVIKCAEQGLYFDAINTDVPEMYLFFTEFGSPKVFAHLYLDDRGTYPPKIDTDAAITAIGNLIDDFTDHTNKSKAE